MAHPLVWPSNPQFFPLGILAATSLTQDLSPEQAADILLLGCGDPRHILYTISTDVTCPPVPRKLDITCCDLEPAILARNILLFTLLEDDVPSNHLWDVFYHFKIGDHAFGLIKSQSRKLLELSESPESWRQSEYGSFLKMVTATSLLEIRECWARYADFSELPADRIKKLQDQYDASSKRISERVKTHLNGQIIRSAANSWREAAKPVNDQFGHYWEHGTTVTTSKELKKTNNLNPTFFYSSLGEGFDVYTNTFPQGYHFSPAFTPILSDPAGPATTSAIAKAKQQFKAGLSAFQMSRKANSIVLRFFVGDALALCRALGQYSTSQKTDTQEFTAPWRATTIDLGEHAASSPPAPRHFDIIDFTTLGSELGILNALLVGQPLLKKRPASQAVLYTDLPMQAGSSIALFHERICHSISTTGLLIGLVPRPYISLFTSLSNTHELLMQNPLYFERIAWVDPASGDIRSHAEPNHKTPYFAFRELTQLVLAIYDTFFMYSRVPIEKIQSMLQLKPDALDMFSAIHYTREFLIALVAHTRSRACLTAGGGWGDLASFALQAVPQVSAPDFDLVHELGVQCLLYRIPYEKIDAQMGEDVARAEVFKDWTDPPPRLVCVVLVVPSNKLEFVRQNGMEPSPRFVCNIVDPNGDKPTKSLFESVQGAWGKCVPIEGSSGAYTIEEGPSGFRKESASDFILSFWVNAEKLVPTGLTVSLNLLLTPLARYEYGKELGDHLTLFSASATDKNHVLILKDRPTSGARPQSALRLDPPIQVADRGQPCTMTIRANKNGGPQIRGMGVRIQLKSESEKAALAKGFQGTTSQVGPCTLKVHSHRATYTVTFPYPILNSLIAVEAHPKTHEIEVTAGVIGEISLRAGGYPDNWFPVLQHTTFSPWNIHHVHPHRLPLIDIQQRDKLKWLVIHTSAQMSDRERIIQRSKHATQRAPDEALVNLKESLSVLIQDYIGLRQGPVRIFALTDMMHGYFCFIFVLGLRLDLAGGTVVLDTALVPIHPKGAEEMSPAITILHHSGQAMMEVRTRPAEVIVWKHLLPAFVERCRTWSHKPNCEYKSTGQVPLGVKPEVNPLCSCGQGVGLNEPEWNDPAWKAVLPFATRAAISPLFGVSYLEEVVGPAAAMQGTQVPTSEHEPSDVCWNCDGLRIGRKLQRCQRCKKARYCSKECQDLHWKAEHKYKCKPA
ncbi:unnamed protein product [Rhizoctonia solani]|uniref:MYND-type domain-containing protein n=3 Tax=Rhizoctonia solani TaxID=456999 RepID=A0A8H3CM43_9AGAM|nr:MYND finger protein, putative [Rhizoctonia solani AG-3 Rhs1AP]KEP48086.1 putative MYND finger protein [Rhizoctonia solani 123E]CAE6392383.1 unnamed protein product [Rhizoctonia solani]CAE6484974.1 unnamed protein product [Rhizoctonia solani]